MAGVDRSEATGQEAGHDHLVVDEVGEALGRFRALRDSGAQADAALEELGGGKGPTDQRIAVELAAVEPLAHPERFLDAHALAFHALEVLHRNGARTTTINRLGPLQPVGQVAVQLVTKFIVRSHEARAIDAIDRLYVRRATWCPPTDPNRLLLVRGHLDAMRVSPTYKSKGNGLPTFLVGGALASSAVSGVQAALGAALGSKVGAIVGFSVLFVLLAGAAAAIVKGAAVARHRIRLTLDRPLAALWETVGHCGSPPNDQARLFALIGLVLTAVGWLVLPLAVILVTAVVR